ncbi:GTP-binding protein REM 2 [Acipenser ruthenus]|uniref:GTP-binding protein REM 2 n=1 Tax=Acipenser ruthenus TaxID=7906 RepID=A0A444U134_ACIRT|nr:GTP-binding protein REM 2 [Acipenser ruthenus]
MTLSSAPPVRRGSTPVPIKHQLKRESAIVCEDYDWTPGLPGPAPPPISFSSASEESIAPAGRGEAGGEGDGDGLIHILLLGQSGVGKTVLAGALAGGDGRTASVDSETTEEARSHAALFECRFVEVSAALDHNTSALLEGAVRLLRRSEGAGPGLSPRRRRESLTKKARRFLQSLVPKHYPSGGKFFRQKSRSCHDLTAT